MNTVSEPSESLEREPSLRAPRLSLVTSPTAGAGTELDARSPAPRPPWPRLAYRLLLRALDVILAPLTVLSAAWLRWVRQAGVHRLPLARSVFRRVGVFPIRNHYYEPLFDPRHLRRPLAAPRNLPGLDLNVSEQLAFLGAFRYQDELAAFPLARTRELRFHYDNGTFGPGDAEYLYSVLRHARPRRMIEIGSGYSTLIAAAALQRNGAEDRARRCDHTCIEPYEAAWLAELGVLVLRERVETIDPNLFASLERNDVLFIDSSHVIRPQGDVLFECLEILPRLKPGVLVHLHDIFTPRDLPEDWVRDRVRFWNEQYLLEAFLCFNRDFRIVGAVNHLKHEHGQTLAEKCPALRVRPDSEPGSFWMVRS